MALGRVEAGAFHLHRQPVGAQVVKERRPLALQFRARSEPRVLRCVHPYVGAGPGGVPPFRDGLAVFAFSHGVHPGTPALEGQRVPVLRTSFVVTQRTRCLPCRPGQRAWALAELSPLFADWASELEELSKKYSDAELGVITDFLIESARRQKTPPPGSQVPRSARRAVNPSPRL